MSVTFSASNLSLDIEEELEYNFGNTNASELLRHIGIENDDDYELCGSILSRKLRLKLEAFLDKPEPARRQDVVNGNYILCGDSRGMHSRAAKLLELCNKAGDLATIMWG
jgi:hypothetical protein